jgi:hypothetical protein
MPVDVRSQGAFNWGVAGVCLRPMSYIKVGGSEEVARPTDVVEKALP